MKALPSKFLVSSLMAAVLGTYAIAQTTVQTTTSTTSMGTISEFNPDTIVVRSTTAAEPVRYRYSKTTTYVDETGTPVSLEIVKSGLPVTVYYSREGNDLVASKVVVRKAVTTEPAPTVIEKKTTTTTTTERERERDNDR